MTNEWLQGYLAALNNVTAFCDTRMYMPENSQTQHTYAEILTFITQVKENYKQLVKDLNEKSKG